MTIWAALLIAVVAWGAEPAPLVVDNQSRHAADVYVWQYTGNAGSWQLVKRVEPGTCHPVHNVREGTRLRAIYGAHYEQYTVQGSNDVWVIRAGRRE